VTEASLLVAEIEARLRGRSRPLLVAIDGPSGSGKSDLAALVADDARSRGGRHPGRRLFVTPRAGRPDRLFGIGGRRAG